MKYKNKSNLFQKSMSCVALLASYCSLSAQDSYLDGYILARVKPGYENVAQDFHTAMGCSVESTYSHIEGLELVRIPSSHDTLAICQAYEGNDAFEFAELDFVFETSRTPNDFHYRVNRHWGLNNTGEKTGSILDADIDAPEAWDVRTDASDIIVAVVDSGIRYTHEELAGNLWINTDEIPGNGVDDDQNGYIDDIYGIDAINDTGDPWDDISGHGTNVAGTIGALGDNYDAGVGVAWDVQIMSLKFLSGSGSGVTSDSIQCINYAIANGADIINNSWGGGSYSQALLAALEACKDAGIIVVGSAGNDSLNLDNTNYYPASYDLDNMVNVAALTMNDSLASFSNYGSNLIDLGAPGEEIWTTGHTSDSRHIITSGTSIAAPFVSGAFALLKAEYPEEDYKQLIDRMMKTVDPIAALEGKAITGGRLNLASAITYTAPVEVPGVILNAWEYSDQYGIVSWNGGVGYFDAEDWLKFSQVDLTSNGFNYFSTSYTSPSSGMFEVRVDSLTGPLLGSVYFEPTGGWSNYETSGVHLNPSEARGTRDVYIIMKQPYANFESFTFGDLSVPAEEDWMFNAWEYDESQGVNSWDGGLGGGPGDWIGFQAVDFGSGYSQIELSYATISNFEIEVRADAPDGPVVGSVVAGSSGGWGTYVQATGDLNESEVRGVRNLYLVIKNGYVNTDIFWLRN